MATAAPLPGDTLFLRKKQLDLQQVQADEIKVKTQGGTVWMALALMSRPDCGWARAYLMKTVGIRLGRL
jgi:hypothetical protein